MNKSENNKEIGLYIRELREGKGLTMLELGHQLGKTEARISQYESGDVPPLKTLTKIAGIFNVGLDDLLRVKSNTISVSEDYASDINSVESLKNKVFSVLSDLEQGKNREQNTNILMSLSVLMVEELVTIQNNYDKLKLESFKKSGIFRKIF